MDKVNFFFKATEDLHEQANGTKKMTFYSSYNFFYSVLSLNVMKIIQKKINNHGTSYVNVITKVYNSFFFVKHGIMPARLQVNN